ncbi:unnamed protein product [Clonostachys rosea]|uniref:Zn(2)-C6 fungal-type domain-containing protein n=1 Tax=Bionectria ochroleuca TaxID=29856 RepID=A0ABY6U119_BIOOC|nr:unnamed protein product [Clonostachys rosea]
MSTLKAPRTSRSCKNCRVLKRRCDKQTPQCGQCIRTHEACSGYRDDWDLVFRDQTGHTIKRSKKKAEKCEISTKATLSASLTRRLDPGLDEIGVNYFLQDFITGGNSPARGYLNYIPAGYSADAEHPTVVASMAAVGLVALASRHPELAVHARIKYSEAIRHVNDALASPVESIKDSTLMSVISLGVFEHVSNFESWVRHVKGAAALVVARGKSQFATWPGILMFNQVRADLSTVCIQSVEPFPDDMKQLQAEATKCVDYADAFWSLGVLATRCADLFAGVAAKHKGLSLTMPMAWSDYLEESIVLQEDFQSALDVLAIQEPYMAMSKLDRSRDEVSYNGRADVYTTSWSIRLWNNSRMVEIIVCEIICWLIRRILTEDPTYPTHDHQRLESKLRYEMQVMSSRVEGIVASVPQGLGLLSMPDADKLQRANVSGGYMLIWNLYAAGKCPVVKHQDRQWIIKQLERISESLGIAMASQLAEDLHNIK